MLVGTLTGCAAFRDPPPDNPPFVITLTKYMVVNVCGDLSRGNVQWQSGYFQLIYSYDNAVVLGVKCGLFDYTNMLNGIYWRPVDICDRRMRGLDVLREELAGLAVPGTERLLSLPEGCGEKDSDFVTYHRWETVVKPLSNRYCFGREDGPLSPTYKGSVAHCSRSGSGYLSEYTCGSSKCLPEIF
jgi:hypothetical protein